MNSASANRGSPYDRRTVLSHQLYAYVRGNCIRKALPVVKQGQLPRYVVELESFIGQYVGTTSEQDHEARKVVLLFADGQERGFDEVRVNFLPWESQPVISRAPDSRWTEWNRSAHLDYRNNMNELQPIRQHYHHYATNVDTTTNGLLDLSKTYVPLALRCLVVGHIQSDPTQWYQCIGLYVRHIWMPGSWSPRVEVQFVGAPNRTSMIFPESEVFLEHPDALNTLYPISLVRPLAYDSEKSTPIQEHMNHYGLTATHSQRVYAEIFKQSGLAFQEHYEPWRIRTYQYHYFHKGEQYPAEPQRMDLGPSYRMQAWH